MREIGHDIRPGSGLGELFLGSSEQQVRALLGEPTGVEHVDYGDHVVHHNWQYEVFGLSLSFAEDDGFRLGSITTEYAWSSLEGCRIVGLEESGLAAGGFGGLGPPVLADDFHDLGRNYEWESRGLSCWVSGGVVVSVTICPLYDETGDIPRWPKP